MSLVTVENMVAFVEDNLTSQLTLCDMARSVGYSEFYCSAKFHEYTGLTFKSYVLKRRLSLAAQRLLSANEKIVDVALDSGFTSHEGFTRAFVKEFGCTPCDFRKTRPNVSLYDRADI